MGSGSGRWVMKFLLAESCGEESKDGGDAARQSNLEYMDSGLRTYFLLVRRCESHPLCDIVLSFLIKNIPILSPWADLRVCKSI